MLKNANELAREDLFQGNSVALQELVTALKTGEALAFTGAGISVPLAPAWTPLLSKLISDGVSDGFIPPEEQGFLKSQAQDDPLELASTLEELYTKARFRAKLRGIFDLAERSTATQDLIVALPFEGIVTLNYDDGLSTAYVRRRQRLPVIVRNDDNYELNRWRQGQHAAAAQLPIIHWHGNISSPERMILTADDYNQFYGRTENKEFISELWGSRQILAIGFGFKDPFLTKIAESVLRTAATGNQHFALIGHSGSEGVSSFVRRGFAKKYRVSPIFYHIVIRDDGSEDHSALTEILAYLLREAGPPKGGSGLSLAAAVSDGDAADIGGIPLSPSAAAKVEFERSLMVGLSDRLLYVEPRIYSPPSITDEEAEPKSKRVTVDEIVKSSQNFAISSPYEHGGTTLGRRFVYELISAGVDAHYADTKELPDYKAKLSGMSIFKRGAGVGARALVLDNVNPSAHEKLLKEIVGLQSFDRIILLCRGPAKDGTDLADLNLSLDFTPLTLAQLRREDIRAFAHQLYDTFDADMVSAAVEKTYNDLLELCIPLTPSNIVMYLSVIYKEGSFVALNRLQIMDRYIRELLQRPSDAYKDSFNVDNKVDLISRFVYFLFKRNSSTFVRGEWEEFCSKEMSRSLSYFDKDSILSDLITSRLVIYISGVYIFKYKLFYSYLLGRYVGERPELVPDFVDNEHHLSVDSLVETIAGTAKDNTYLVTSLVERLEQSLSEFENQYHTGELDPYHELEWALTDDEEEKVWRPVAERLANGPASGSEVDRVKRSIMAEQRTEDQTVIVRQFRKIERSVSYNQMMLTVALKESPSLDGQLKIRATKAIFKGYKLVMQIGFLFAPIIATRRFFMWNNVAFINEMTFSEEEREDPNKQASLIAGAIPPAITERAVAEIGSKKLGEVYKYLSQNEALTGFDRLVLFSLLIRAKPEGWEGEARLIINQLERRELYLRYMLSEMMKQFRQDLNTNADRMTIKRLVATVQAKRRLNKDKPTAKAVAGILQRLEKVSYFEGRTTSPQD